MDRKVLDLQENASSNSSVLTKIELLKTEFEAKQDINEKKFSELTALQKAMETENENMINIKISNQVRNIDKKVNDRLREIMD